MLSLWGLVSVNRLVLLLMMMMMKMIDALKNTIFKKSSEAIINQIEMASPFCNRFKSL